MSNQTAGWLRGLLGVLLGVCVVVEAGIASYVGINVQNAWQANLELKAQQVAIEAERERMEANPPAIQYVGPGVQVVDGVLIRGEWEPTDTVESSSVISRYSPTPVPKTTVPKASKPSPTPSRPESSSSSAANTQKPSASNNQPAAEQKPSNPSSGQSDTPVTANPSDGGQSNAQTTPPSSGSSSGTESKPAASNAATVQNADGTYKHDFSGGRVLGTVNSDKYHNSDCIGARKIPPENEVWYSSVADAVAAGRSPCGNCYR